jgi:hypothetical protein
MSISNDHGSCIYNSETILEVSFRCVVGAVVADTATVEAIADLAHLF